MPVRESEAIVLRTYPLSEADKIVSLFTRDMGRMRGVAKNARRSMKRFGAALERLSHVKVRYTSQEGRDLARLESCELIQSFFDLQSDYEAGLACGYIAEVCEHLLPEHEANDHFFRLVLLVLGEIQRTRRIWRPLTYFDLWAVTLSGFLPQLDACTRCREPFQPGETSFFRYEADALFCKICRPAESWALMAESRATAKLLLSKPLTAIPDEGWNKSRAEDLRRFLGQQIEKHLERKLVTRPMIDTLN